MNSFSTKLKPILNGFIDLWVWLMVSFGTVILIERVTELRFPGFPIVILLMALGLLFWSWRYADYISKEGEQ